MPHFSVNFHNIRPYGNVDFVVRESALAIVFAFSRFSFCQRKSGSESLAFTERKEESLKFIQNRKQPRDNKLKQRSKDDRIHNGSSWMDSIQGLFDLTRGL